ncbi:MAG TPA: endonuclease/exonuclease/phosphatase family protein [Candidatus Acidoferrum sp.]|jgi:endonuclease/exonuclease/phosphatase family metal-dependent hydrolase|nr:endonuclease/exonuclease/phosphatase family protein [Candidatus Acidoferrum sp.]
MTKRLRQSAGQFLKRFAPLAGLLAGLALVLETGGCASGRPARLRVEHQVTAAPTGDPATWLSLKVVTYNVWGLPSWMSGARSGRYPRIARELERLDPDVILLQEAWTANARKSAPVNGRWSIARAVGQHTFFQQSGLVTLSRLPIIGGEFYPFSRAAFPDRFVNKGVLKVTVRLPGGQVLNIWNVHLQDGGSPEIRYSQIREVESHVLAAEDGQIADLVGGDFNCTPESPFCRELADCVGPSVQQLGGGEPFVTWDGLSANAGAGQTLDYIFIRGRNTLQNLRAASRVAFAAASLQQRLSDHLGIEADMSLDLRPILAGTIGGPLLKETRLNALTATQSAYAGSDSGN